MYILPVAGRLVRDPVTHACVPEAGRAVPETPFWIRRLRDGDVVEGTAPAAEAANVSDKE